MANKYHDASIRVNSGGVAFLYKALHPASITKPGSESTYC